MSRILGYQAVGQESQQLEGNVGTGLGVSKGVVVISEVKAAVCGNGVQPVVGQLLEQALSGSTGAEECIIGVIHLIAAEDGFQTTLVKGFIMSDQRKTLDEWLDLCPYVRKNRSPVCVVMT